MTFKQILSKANQNHIPAWRLLVATEVEDYLFNNGYKVSEEEYNNICCFVYDWVISSNATPYDVVDKLVPLIFVSKKYSIDEINVRCEEIIQEINEMF